MERKNKNILWITPGFARDEKDDSCIPTLQDLAIEYKKDTDLNLWIVSLYYPFIKKEYLWNGIPVKCLGAENPKGLSKGLFLLKAYRELSVFIKKNDIEIIQSFWLQDATLLSQKLAKKFRLKHIATIMGQDAKPSKYHRVLDYSKMTVVALSTFAMDYFLKHSSAEIKLVPFGLADITFQNKNRDIDLLAVGSIIPLKNHLNFVELVFEVKKRRGKVSAKIIGEFHDKELLEKIYDRIKELNLEEDLEVLDKMSRAQVYDYYQRSKILAHLSLFEGQAMSRQEAILNGCHVLSYGAGYLFDVTEFNLVDEKTIVEKAILLLDSSLAHSSQNLITVQTTKENYKKLFN